jgi:hypothetical protein
VIDQSVLGRSGIVAGRGGRGGRDPEILQKRLLPRARVFYDIGSISYLHFKK